MSSTAHYHIYTGCKDNIKLALKKTSRNMPACTYTWVGIPIDLEFPERRRRELVFRPYYHK